MECNIVLLSNIGSIQRDDEQGTDANVFVVLHGDAGSSRVDCMTPEEVDIATNDVIRWAAEKDAVPSYRGDIINSFEFTPEGVKTFWYNNQFNSTQTIDSNDLWTSKYCKSY